MDEEDTKLTKKDGGKKNNLSVGTEHVASDSVSLFSIESDTQTRKSNRFFPKLRYDSKKHYDIDIDYSKCTPGDVSAQNLHKEQSLHHLNLQKGKVKIHPKIHQIRAILDKYAQMNPIVSLHEPFNFSRFFWEGLYNFLHFLAFPIIIYKEGKHGLIPREFVFYETIPLIAPIASGLIWICVVVANVLLIILSTKENQTIVHTYIFQIIIMNLLFLIRIIVIGIKYGYYPSHVFQEFQRYPPVSHEYLHSLHLMPGWGGQLPLTMAREFWLSQERLHIELCRLRLTFRDTKAFDLSESKYCSCSRWATMLDWLIPFLYVFTNAESVFLKRKNTFLFLLINVSLIFFSNYQRIDYCGNNKMDQIYCWIITICIALSASVNVHSCIVWALHVSRDFTKRWERVVFCTRLLDPKLEAFVGEMKKTYKVHVFAALGKISKNSLKKLNLHTIDLYNPDSIYSWSQLRNIIFDCGKHFLLREQAYNGVLICFIIVYSLLFLYILLHKDGIMLFIDVITMLYFACTILIPTMWTLSCANSINWETETQKRLLSERIVEMQFHELKARQKGLTYWEEEIKQAKAMAIYTVDILNQDVYEIKVLGLRVDTSVVQITATLILCLIYVLSIAIYNSTKIQFPWE